MSKEKDHIKLVVAQIELTIGDLEKNKQNVLNAIKTSKEKLKADIVLFPELCITGYPPEDLLLRDDFHIAVNKVTEEIVSEIKDMDVIITYPYKNREDGNLYNAAALVRNGKIVEHYYKQLLPNYSVFDEKRYFTRGRSPCIFELNNIKIGINICEDIWYPDGPVKQAKEAGAELILSTNASPFCIDKASVRKQVVKDRALEVGLPVVYAHNVGAHDEIVFDGGSIVVNANGKTAAIGPFFKEELMLLECFRNEDNTIEFKQASVPQPQTDEELIYKAIMQGIRTYVHNSGYRGALVGLSGGIDSAVTLALATAALGKDNVTAVIMPSQYTADESIEDSITQCKKLGVDYFNINIDNTFDSFTDALKPAFEHPTDSVDITMQNIQARTRGVILMAISNKLGKLVLATGNKSEMAVGYATLYGDMVGGFAPIKDLFKGMVYRLANYINSISDNFIIPQRVIKREPTAELAPNQKDQDTLPPYDVLDGILRRYVVFDMGLDQIAADGFERNIVAEVIDMVDKNEYKRRQAAPGVRISAKAFGRDRRFPIISGYKYDHLKKVKKTKD